MKLRSAAASPFARKARMAVIVAGLNARVTVVDTNTREPDAAFLDDNPLGKIPVLILDDGSSLYDSRVIAAYLDDIAGPGRLIPLGQQRFPALRLEALADGIMDAIVLQVYERHWRTEDRRDLRWIAHQAAKVTRGLAEARRLLAQERPDTPIHIGHLSLAAALGYLDLRFAGTWRHDQPDLVDWLDRFAQRCPAFEATRLRVSS